MKIGNLLQEDIRRNVQGISKIYFTLQILKTMEENNSLRITCTRTSSWSPRRPLNGTGSRRIPGWKKGTRIIVELQLGIIAPSIRLIKERTVVLGMRRIGLEVIGLSEVRGQCIHDDVVLYYSGC